MAVRLHMKLGVVAEADRLEDSPDTVAVVEPTIGATLRSKGSMYVVVAGVGRARRLQEATRLVSDTLQGEYYYDESAGLVVCLEKAVRAANRKLAASRERPGPGGDGAQPLGLGVAVVRGSELYVTVAGPVEAYLVRQAHLLTLPDSNAGVGLPADEVTPHVWRGEMAPGDTVVLVSRNMTATLGPEELKDAINTLHPQAAMERLHQRFVAAGGTGSDGALAIEATEVAATSQRGRLVPARPAEPLAGAPDRSPIPLADSVGGGVAAVSAGASRARSAAGNAVSGLVGRVQDLLPRRGPRYRRVTPAATKRESQRRAAVAVLAFVAVASALGVGLWLIGGAGGGAIDEVTAGERALAAVREDLRLAFHNGADLVVDDPRKAEQLLVDAYQQLGAAASNGVPATTLGPLRTEVVGGLDALYGVVDVAAQTAFSFAAQDRAFDLAAIVLGPDGVPYVLDRASKTVYRVDLRAKKAIPVIQPGTASSGTKVSDLRYLTVGGPDVLALDVKNVLWRWRPADSKGKGTLARIRIAESSTWGADILGIGTFVRSADEGLYNLYVIDPSEQQVLRYSPAVDGSGYPQTGSGYLTTPQDVSKVTSMYIDGELYLADGGVVERFVRGRSDTWRPADPPDALLRPLPVYRLIDSPGDSGEGSMYGYDPANARIVAWDKASGRYQAQYRVAAGGTDWADVRGFYVVARAAGQAPLVYWVSAEAIGTATLEPAAAATPSASPSAAPGGRSSPSPASSPRRTPKPTARPSAAPTP